MTSLQSYKNGGFPPSSKLMNKMWNYENYKKHRKKLQNVKPYLEISPPREYQHLQLSVKKLQMQQERQATIDRQNEVILNQLMKIKQSPARVDNWNKDWQPTHDRLRSFRERRQRRIKLENEKQHERLKNIQPYYDVEKWEKDFKKHQYYLTLLDGGTKEYEEIEDEDEESESDEEEKERLPPVDSPDGEKGEKTVKKKKDEQVKLPPIQNKKKTKDGGGKKKEDYPEHVVIMDAEDINKAIEENDKEKILQILGRVSEKKKMDKLKQKYKELYDKDLMEEVKPKLDEELQETLDCLGSGADEDAKKLYEAMKGLGTDEDILIEILCTRTNAHLNDIRAAYSRKYEHSLEEDLKGDTSGDLETLLVELSKGQRDESNEVDKEMAKKDAKEIYEAGTASWGTDEGKFIRIFTLRSRPQLGATFPEYKKLTSKDIAESIDNEMDGDLQKAFLSLVKCIRDPTGFHSDKLHDALQEGDTKTVARILLGKNKAQLDELAVAYKKAHKAELADEIGKKCSGDLRTLLLGKLGKGAENKKQQKPVKQEKPKKEAVKEKPKAKPTAAQDNKKTDKNMRPGAKQDAVKDKPKGVASQNDKKTDKNTKKNNEENKEATLERDLDELKKAIDAGDKDKAVDVIAKHSDEKSKLQQLKDKYKEKHDQDLLEAVKPVLEEEQLQDAADSLFMESDSYDAKIMYYAMKGLGTDEDVLTEILCSRSNAELAKIKEKYTAFYGRSLEKDIKGDTSGNFENLLVELSKGKRDETSKIDKSLAQKDAEAIMQASFLGTDEDKFVQVFTQRSFPHLKVVFQEYKKLTNQEMDECIEEEMSQDLEKGFLALVKYTRDPSTFYANKIQKSLQEGETDTRGRIILTRTTAELADILGRYKKVSGNDLTKDAEAKFSENMKKLILPKLKKAGQEQKEKERASNDSKKKKQTAANKQEGAGGKKPTVNRKPSQQKRTQQDDKQEYADLRAAIDANDKKKIKEIVCRNLKDKEQAKKLVEDYNARYGKELFEALDEKLGEDLLEALAALSLNKAQHDARTLHLAMKGLFTKEIVLIEVFSMRTNAEIAAIRQAYKKKYRKELEQVIKDETSGDFETLLVELSKGQRDEGTDVSDDLAHKDAESLLEAGIKKWGTDEETFITIFTTRSFPQLKLMLPEYKKWAKCEIEDTIDSEMSGDLRDGLQTLVKCIRDKNQFLAEKLQVALHGKSTATAARIVLGEGVIAEVEKSYNQTYKPKLAAEIDAKCSNELKKLLLPNLKDTGPDKEPQKSNKPSGEKSPESKSNHDKKPEVENKPKVIASGQNMEPSEKPRENDKGSGEQEQEKKKERSKLNIEKTEHHGTLKPADNFNAAEDAETLKKAMKGFGSDEDAIMAVLGARTNQQRQEIAAKYQQEYDKNLVDDLKSELGGKFEDAIVALMSPPKLFDANSLHDAMSGLGTDEAVLIEILCSRSPEEIQEIKSTFKEVHGKKLVEEIKSETSGDLQSTLIKLVEGERSTSEKVDEDLAYEDATKLLEAGEDKWGTNESVFVNILTTRSTTQLQATFEAYKHVAKCDIMDSVNSELTGDFHDSVEAIVRCTRNPPLFFAETLEKAISGIGSDSKAVTRVVVSRSEVDLAEIKTEYQKKTGKSLRTAVENELKGDLEKLLLQIVGD
ncbi:uncharacterized protein LOC111347232 [Stylophora pistillata]|uniref:uncharacterized protein LOC111347232 n=1 Tax=Stylophora pistillata TaxID=50429 RepID=UPI000C03EFA6|nr:uncharacterized protein LOC111347232 [Stylophora pistillata]